jgi:hypothetical protein
MVDPGHPVTLTVTATLRALVDLLMGDAELGAARREGLVAIEGERELGRKFGQLFEFDGSEWDEGSGRRAALPGTRRPA